MQLTKKRVGFCKLSYKTNRDKNRISTAISAAQDLANLPELNDQDHALSSLD